VKAMILAAGLGTRLRPLTLDRPKPLVDVHGRPLIAYNLLLLRRWGIVDVVINLHHQGDALRAALGDGGNFGVRIVYSAEDPLLDTGGAIKNAAALLGDDDFVVLNGDTIIDLPLDTLVAARDHGVDPEYVGALAGLGYSAVPLDTLITMRDHGVDPEFVRGLAALGYKGLPLEALRRMRDHGVDPDFVRRVLQRDGGRPSVDQLIERRDRGGDRAR